MSEIGWMRCLVNSQEPNLEVQIPMIQKTSKNGRRLERDGTKMARNKKRRITKCRLCKVLLQLLLMSPSLLFYNSNRPLTVWEIKVLATLDHSKCYMNMWTSFKNEHLKSTILQTHPQFTKTSKTFNLHLTVPLEILSEIPESIKSECQPHQEAVEVVANHRFLMSPLQN